MTSSSPSDIPEAQPTTPRAATPAAQSMPPIPVPDLALLTALLSRLLAKLEEPSGDLDTALAQMLSQLQALAAAMEKAAMAMTTATSPDGPLGRLTDEIAAMRQAQAAQSVRTEWIERQMAAVLSLLDGPLTDGVPPSPTT